MRIYLQLHQKQRETHSRVIFNIFNSLFSTEPAWEKIEIGHEIKFATKTPIIKILCRPQYLESPKNFIFCFFFWLFLCPLQLVVAVCLHLDSVWLFSLQALYCIKIYNFYAMKVLQAVVFFLAITAIAAEPLQLYSASTFLDASSGPLTGSLLGGRTIYIKGVGFPTNPTQIQVMIGNFPCKIPADGITPTTLSCETTSCGSTVPIYNLPIKVISNFEIYTLSGFVFSYVSSDTPLITDVFPSSSVGDKLLNYYGRHRVLNSGDGARNIGDFIGLYAGNELCGMFDIQQGEISYNSISRVKCLQARLQEAGKYNVSEHVVAGWAFKEWTMQKPSLRKQYYEHTVLPAVSSVTPSSGALIGQDIVIKGTGFSLDKTKISVSVDGVNCAISSSTLTQIACRVASKQPTDSAQLSSNSGSPVNNYISGVGFKYYRYNISGLVNRNIGGFKAAVNAGSAELTLIESGHIAELETPDIYQTGGYGQVFKGYFYAPVTGNYIFRGVSDDTFTLYISSQYGTTGSTLTEEIYELSPGWSDENHYFSNHTTAIGRQKALVGGKYYYMEAYHVNWIGPGYFKISVEVPNTDATLIKKRYQIDHIETTYTNDPEIMTFTLNNAIGGTFNLSVYRVDPATLQVTYNKQVSIPFNANVNQFQNAVNQFDLYSSYGTTCTDAKAYDQSGNVVALDSGLGVKFQWTVSVYKLRTTAHLSQRFTAKLGSVVAPASTTAAFNEVRTRNHCPLLNGTFSLSVGSTPIKIYDSVTQGYTNQNIPADVAPWTLEAAFQQFAGFEKVRVHRVGDPNYGGKWIISYVQYTGNVPDLVVSGSGLTGGRSGTFPTVAAYQTRPYSPNIIFNPVNQNFMFMASNKPNIIVTVNQIRSVCLSNCEYTFLPNTPMITSQSLSGSIVSLTLSNPLSLNYPLSMLTAKVDGRVCNINPSGTFASFNCQLPVNGDNSPILRAGDYDVELFLMEVGYISKQPAVPTIHYPLTITTVTQNSGGDNGGYEITLTGNGFPTTALGAKITLCGVQVQITQISNTQTKILAPPCSTTGLQTITYEYNNQTTTGQFTYTSSAAVSSLISIYPKSASPVLKAVMTITGTGFGTNLSAVTVSLANATGKVYRMRVLEVNDTVVKCGIPGGLPGRFDVKVGIDGLGDILPVNAAADDFTYELVVDTITPATVSYHGGTLLTITGRNFSPDKLDNLVHVGNELNWLCAIQSINASEIKCRVPGYHPDWTSGTQGIVVNNRLILDSECGSGSCSISYSDRATSPSLTSSNLTLAVSGMGSISLSGANLNVIATADVKVIFENKLNNLKTIVVPTSVAAGSVTVNIPSVPAGYYGVRVRLDPIGETNSLEINIQGSIASTSMTGSIQGGKVVISGTGLPSEWPSKMFSIKVLTNTFYQDPVVISTTTTEIRLSVPQGTPNQVTLFTLTNPLDQKFTINYTQTAAATPTLSILTASPLATGSRSVQLNRTNFNSVNPNSIQVYNILDPKTTTPVPTWTTSGTVINFSWNFKAGKYGFKVYYNAYGWASVADTISVTAPATYTAAPTDSSYAGGKIVVTGADISPQAVIRVGGFVGKATDITATSATFQIPPLITPTTLQTYPQLSPTPTKIPSASIISDSPLSSKYSFDNVHSTYYSSNNTQCYIGIDSGQNRLINIKRIRYFPYNKWVIAAQFIKDAVFQASTDGVNYVQIGVVDQTVHAGWNSFLVNTNANYRYVRLKHNNMSHCQLAEFEVYGVLLNDITVGTMSSFTTSAIFDDGYNQVPLTNAITYKTTVTPVITATVPSTLSIYGNEVVAITGQNLNFATGKVFVDNIECLVNAAASTATHLECTTQARPVLPDQTTFKVMVGNNKAIIRQDLIYVMRWSDIRTWGTDLPPVEGDLVYVPKGMSLYVDQSTPRLDGIVVEDGKLIFADETDMQIHTNLITINRGEFRAGTEKKPYQRKLTFIMYGSYYGKQQPMFGNKGIGCMECKFSMYGTPRVKTWSVLSSTINVGATTFSVQDTVDWQVGEEIVVASTSFDHNEAERRIITAINSSTITVDQPFTFRHLGIVQTYGNDRLELKAEVGLLTRNIKMMGDPSSVEGEYGSHLMMAGSSQNGLVSNIAYTEFTHCGQPRIVGRYCIHFHMNGDVADSFAKGNAVHDSFARVITIHGVHFLTVSENVGYRVKGHNFFIEDGIETMNVIEYNLVIGSLESWNMMQTDISVASFWVTNPTNHLRFNRAAGGDFYGFWYEIKAHPDGPSATEDICPIGNPLGESHDNVAHSYKRFGLRIFRLYSRQRPCDPIRADHLADPWSDNPSIPSKFYNYLTYKNGEAGLLAEQTGNMVFENFTISDSKRSAIEFYRTNFTREIVEARNMAIIGLSTNNGGDILTMNNSAGAIAPRSSNWAMSNIRFYNFASYMNVLTTCSNCDLDLLFTNAAHQYLVSNISYNNISGRYLRMNGLRREIIYDLDATFSSPFNGGSRTSATITNIYPHLEQESACSLAAVPALWDNTIICDQTIKIRRITFTNLRDQFIFEKAPIKLQLLSDVYEEVPENSTEFTQAFSIWNDMEPMIHMKKSYAIPFVAGRIYNIWWLTGLDFTHLNIDVTDMYQDTDPAIIFKFNYTQIRQSFEVGHLINGYIQNLTSPLINQTLDVNTCEMGDYTHDVDNRIMTTCATSRGKLRLYEYLDIVGIKCRYICPSDTDEYVKENFLRLWSNVTQWPGGVIPQDGANVTVPGEWTILIDIQPNTFGNWFIKGDVIIPDTMLNVHFKAQNIWVWSGSIKAGTSSVPHPGSITFEILGNKNDRGIVIDPSVAGNKLFVVTGRLELYGEVPATAWTKLTAMARPGDTTIRVQSVAGWQVGGEIAIAPSFSSSEAHEKVTITAITGTTVTFTPALRFTHYGASGPTIVNAVGTLDTRAGVGYLSRKIRIIAGPDSGWGYHLIGYGYVDNTTLRTGSMVLQGVQLYEGGQYDTENTALKLKNTVGNKTVKIYKSTFHNCKSLCLDIDNINNAEIRDNVFYNGRLFHVRALRLRQYVFENNLMIAATKRPTLSGSELISCYATYDALHEVQASVRHNLCQGSDGYGFILPFVPCALADSPPYDDNTVGSAFIGWTFNKIAETCLAGSGAKAYACSIGHMASSPQTITIMFSKFMIADSNRGLTLRFGKEYDDSTAYLRNSYVSAISRPTCSECYGPSATQCRDARGVRMLAVTVNGQSLPMIFGRDFDIICRMETFDCKAFIQNVIFQNFNINYGQLPQCSNNSVFEPHRLASDMTGTHHLYNTVCNNCSLNALGRFTPPLPEHMGWFGGCGRIPCTGRNNYMVQDHTGHYLGSPGFLLANNSEIGQKTEGCTYVPYMNGHHCRRLDYGVIEYESIAPDFNTRIMWPVYLKFDGGLWNTTTNGWREWDWQGNEPQNHRVARFVSIVQVNQVYNMTFESEPPIDMRFQFQRRYINGNNSEYVVIKLHYPRPNSIRVQNRNNVIKPISLLDNNGQNPLNTTVCGSNKFFYQNYTIHFVITADSDCQVRVSLTNSIQLTARFSMDINNFFAIDGETKFINRMCALLGIVDTSRLKVVGIYNGSVIIHAYIDESMNTTVANATQNDNDLQKKQMAQLDKKLGSLYDNGQLATSMTEAGLGQILDFQSQAFYHTYDNNDIEKEQEEELAKLNEKSKSLAIALGVAISSLVVIIIAGVLYVRKLKAKIDNTSQTLNTEAKIEETIVDTVSADGWK